MRRGMRVTMVVLLLGASGAASQGDLASPWVPGAWASPRTTCTSRYDAQFQRVVTTCTDGSRAVSRYDRQFQRWRTDITKPGAVDKMKPRR